MAETTLAPLTRAGREAMAVPPAWQEAMSRAWRASYPPTCHHCWHPYVGAWAGSQPPPMHCCWCGQTHDFQLAMLTWHGPYAGGG